ncbi:MAG: D-alanyl-D-alanine carboxypeptidase/D-alanyl-D-alanine-endopeptidase [Solirubrobacterales bacterium]
MKALTRDLGRLLAAGLLPAALVVPALLPGTSAASPAPLPNPDRPAVTPVATPAAPAASRSVASSCTAMRRQAGKGNSAPSLVVLELGSGETACALNPGRARSLASNTKILTTAAVLGRLGPSYTVQTRLFTDGTIDSEGTLEGSLYLKGGGDPALGTGPFLENYLGGAGTDIDSLALQARKAGLKRVTGRVYGDESIFDSLRGVADSGYSTSPWIGPLSGLSINAGFTGAGLSEFSSSPARLAARTLAKRLRKRGVSVTDQVALARTPNLALRSRPLAVEESEDMAWMADVTNLNSNNFFAEMLVKLLGATKGNGGSTKSGTRVVREFAASLGASVDPVDGSGLTVTNRASAEAIARLLVNARDRDWWSSLYRSLPIAGREGTVAYRMRGTAAEGRCRTKTGTLTGVSALSGYCFNRSGRRFAFSILMNGVSDTYDARAAQDRIAALVAGL